MMKTSCSPRIHDSIPLVLDGYYSIPWKCSRVGGEDVGWPWHAGNGDQLDHPPIHPSTPTSTVETLTEIPRQSDRLGRCSALERHPDTAREEKATRSAEGTVPREQGKRTHHHVPLSLNTELMTSLGR